MLLLIFENNLANCIDENLQKNNSTIFNIQDKLRLFKKSEINNK